ncbi:MAG: hypothetical protein N2558_00505 [Patescibacteria group bacterium]|nr:hypothetical protein [Patescibacteria group bacterium]
MKKNKISLGLKLFFTVTIYAILVILLNILSYGKAIDFDFWRDDWFTIWAGKFQNSLIWESYRNRFLAPYFNWVFINVIGPDSYLWQFAGLISKIIASFLIGSLGYVLFSYVSVGLFASLIFSSGPYSMESFSWARFNGFILILSLISFAFYVVSINGRTKKRLFFFIFSNVFASLLFLFDLWRGIALLFLIPAFEFIVAISKPKPVYKFRESLLRIFIFVCLQFFVIKEVIVATSGKSSMGGKLDTFSIIAKALSEDYYTRFFITIGNIIRSPFFPVNEEGGLSAGDNTSLILGFAFVLFLVAISLFFLIKKSLTIGKIALLLWWLVLFYLPNWLYEPMISLGVTHRYVSIGNIGLVLVIGFLLSRMQGNYKLGILSVFIVFYLLHANKIITTEEKFRSRYVVRAMWGDILKTVPVYSKDVVLSVSGDHALRGYVFDWSGVYPYVYFRGIRSFEEFPVFANKETMIRLMCDTNVDVTDWLYGGTKKSGKIYNPEKIYAWRIDDLGVFRNVTEETRIYVVKNADCLWKSFDGKFAYFYLPSVDSENKYSALFVKLSEKEKIQGSLTFTFVNSKNEIVRKITYSISDISARNEIIKFPNEKDFRELKVIARFCKINLCN